MKRQFVTEEYLVQVRQNGELRSITSDEVPIPEGTSILLPGTKIRKGDIKFFRGRLVTVRRSASRRARDNWGPVFRKVGRGNATYAEAFASSSFGGATVRLTWNCEARGLEAVKVDILYGFSAD